MKLQYNCPLSIIHYQLTVILMGVLLASCNREIEVSDPGKFNVTTESATYKVGEEIKFNISGGDAHIISFYSGEILNDYNYRDGRKVNVSDSSAVMSFQSSVQNGTQANQVSILASNDFNGDYSSLANVKAATWIDITNRFALGTSTTFLASGTKNIKDLFASGKPVYIAFKYLTKPQAVNGLVRTWYIQSFTITSTKKLDDNITLTLADQMKAAFRIVDENPVNAPALSTITSTRITLVGNRYKVSTDPLFDPANPIYDPTNPIYDPLSPLYVPTAVRPVFVPFDPSSPYNDPQSEHWAVSAAIRTDSIDLGPDWSIPLKGISNSDIEEYRYTYSKPGTYKAIFIASNNSIDDVKRIYKEITLTIVP